MRLHLLYLDTIHEGEKVMQDEDDPESTPTGNCAQPGDNHFVIGQVVGIHIDEAFINNGIVDMAAMRPIARCGYMDYVVADSVFSLKRPT